MSVVAVHEAPLAARDVETDSVSSVVSHEVGGSLYVGDLGPNVSETALFEHFQSVGPMTSVRICRDAITRQSLGYGYVNFADAAHAQTAIETKNSSYLTGSCIRVMPVQRDPTTRRNAAGNIFIKNLPPDLNTNLLLDMFRSIGNILSCKVVVDEKGKSRGYGFVHFANEGDAEVAIKDFNGKFVNSLELYVAPFVRRAIRQQQMQNNYTNVYIKHLQSATTEEDIREHFKQFGSITSTCTKKDPTGRLFAFCSFSKHDEAVKAIEESHDKNVEGITDADLKLYVQRAQKRWERLAELRARYEQNRFSGLGSKGNNLYVKNFGDHDSTELRDLFREYGEINSVFVAKDDTGAPRGYAFVCFSKADAASQALREMNGRLLNNKPLYVNVAQKKETRRTMLQIQFSRPQGIGNLPGAYTGYGTVGLTSSYGVNTALMPFRWYSSPQAAALFMYDPATSSHGAGGGLPPYAIPRPLSRRQLPPARGRVPYRGAAAAAAAAYHDRRLSRRPQPQSVYHDRQQQQQQQHLVENPTEAAGAGLVPPTGGLVEGTGVGGALPSVPSTPALRSETGGSTAGGVGKTPSRLHGTPVGTRPVPLPSPMLSATLKVEDLAGLSVEERHGVLGERLYVAIHGIYPEEAPKITGMLLETEPEELVRLLSHPADLQERVREAYGVLQAYRKRSEEYGT